MEQQVNLWIEELSASLGQSWKLIDNVCSLADPTGDMMVNIEWIPNKEQVLIAASVAKLPTDPKDKENYLMLSLSLNSLPDMIGKSWLSLSPDGERLFLMSALDVYKCDSEIFAERWKSITQMAQDIGELLKDSDKMQQEIQEKREAEEQSKAPSEGLKNVNHMRI